MTRQEALCYFKRRKKIFGLSDEVQEAEDMAIKALEQELKAKWIPVSERLPEEYCLFCDIDGDVFYGHIYDGRWWAEGQDDRIKNVVAWMPLPEPYKESEGNNGN